MAQRYKARKTNETYIAECIAIHGSRYIYDKVMYRRSSDKVDIVCRQHGIFALRAELHLEGKGCPHCSEITFIRGRRGTTTEEYIRRCKKIHKNRYTYNKTVYVHHREDLIVTCKIHGDFDQRPDRHLQGQGCPQCAWDARTKVITTDPEVFKKRAAEIHFGRYTYEKTLYSNSYTKVTITCPEHGDFEQLPKLHLQRNGCKKCKGSKGEKAVGGTLERLGISYQPEFSFPDTSYRYDFHLTEWDVLIEFHGKQHYKPVDYFGGEETFLKIKHSDNIKFNMARDRNIPLIVLNDEHLKTNAIETTLIEHLLNISISRSLIKTEHVC